MHCGIIKTFIEQFRNCPKCGNRLQLEAKQKQETERTRKFSISTASDRLTINITSAYFISPGSDNFEFSISIIDGQIIYSDQTNQFISLYDLDIILHKDCKHCLRGSPPETFHQSINIFYDRSESAFTAEPWIESFSFVYDDNYYYFSNNFVEQRSFLSVQILESPVRSPVVLTPFIPFEKFEFRDRERLFSKINSIRLLV
jgi:hypothetical protein